MVNYFRGFFLITEDWWDEIPAAEIKYIEKGIAVSKEGGVKVHSEARKIYEKWL